MKYHQYYQKKLKRWLLISLILSAGTLTWVTGFQQNNQPPPPTTKNTHTAHSQHFTTFQKKIKPIMVEYCYECHMDGENKGSLDLDAFTSFASMTKDRESWAKIKDHIELKLMPPVDQPQPKPHEAKTITNWINKTIFYTNPNNPDPGNVPLRRLNRQEYKNTIKDLIGIDIDVTNLLPLDDTGYGFDTIASVHTISPAHIEKYLNTAETILKKATVIGKMPHTKRNYDLNKIKFTQDKFKGGTLFTNGAAIIHTKKLPKGIYELKFSATSTQAGNQEALVEVKNGNKSLTKVEIPHGPSATITTLKLNIKPNEKITIGFINDFHDPKNPIRALRDRNVTLQSISLTGPLDAPPPEKPAIHYAILPHKLISQTPTEYALETWMRFAEKVFRRPVKIAEIQPYTKFLNPNNQSKQALQKQILNGMQAMLCSPHFLFIKNTPQNQTKPTAPLTELALASRLSYFLWSSAPDKSLINKANNNTLRKTLKQEINRMLDDPKAQRFIKNFGGQWLQLRDLDIISPDPKKYPKWTKQLKNDAITETHLFLNHLLKTNTSILDCIDADYTFLNQRLAKFYNIPHIKGKHFRKTKLPNKQRGGLLTQISVLTLTSAPDRTSPVLRGKWILENILGTPTPPPPGDIPSIEAENTHLHKLSFRKQLELHRAKPQCAACHNLLDPLGFTLENYNAIGEWRITENNKPINSFGKLITGETFQNSAEMKSILKNNKANQFLKCITEKLLTYSIGRGIEYYDKDAVNNIITQTKKNNLTLRSLIHAICKSTPFQMTRTKAFNK